MSVTDISKAEKHYFHPDELISWGVPERCSNCPSLSGLVSRIALSSVERPLKDNASTLDKIFAREDSAQRDKIMEKVGACAGSQTLEREEISAVMASYDEDDRWESDTTNSIGYRCGSDSKESVAITYSDGVVELLSSA